VSTTSPPSRFYHTATLVGDYMIVAFGRNNIYLPPPGSNEIFILYTADKSDYKWVGEFIPPQKPSVPSTTSASTTSASTLLDSYEINKNQGIIRNLIIGVVTLSTVVVSIGCLF